MAKEAFIYTIMIEPEGHLPYLHPAAYTTIEAAREMIKLRYNNPEQLNDYTYRSASYTYYYIDKLEVK